MNGKLVVAILWGLLFTITTHAQELNRSQIWYHLDKKADQIPGISSNRFYAERLQAANPFEVVVAVIDGGVDVNHEDLIDVLWVNEDEIVGNGIDDDGNGYIDDIHGWSFISGKAGEVHYDTYEMTRELVRLRDKQKQQGLTKAESAYLNEVEKAFNKERKEMGSAFKSLSQIKESSDELLTAVGRNNPSAADIKAFNGKTKQAKLVKNFYIRSLNQGASIAEIEKSLLASYEQVNGRYNFGLNTAFDPRHLVGDNYADTQNRFYGDNRVSGPDAEHGTHVAGIIAATRNNDKGMNGIALNARIMVLRAVPSGDERDKDVANAIRYAVDNGAKVINMSFGKSFSPQPELVREAVEYARSKDVLLVHAAGNDAKNIDQGKNFPQPFDAQGNRYEHWIEVGASSFQDGKNITASFSNYGPKSVDVFAPGDYIYSTMPGSKYDFNSGTSMAAPVVAGMAAIIRGMYPELTARQVRDIIRRSTQPVKGKVLRPGSKKKVSFNQLAATNGIVNLEACFKVIETLDFLQEPLFID